MKNSAMEREEMFRSVAKVGRTSNRCDQKRRGTPIPVAPPRVPTPMPQPGEVAKRLAEQKWRSNQGAASQSNRNNLYVQQTSVWITPNLLQKEILDSDTIYQEDDVKDIYRARQLSETNKNKLEKTEKTQDTSKKRIRIKWFQGESKRDKSKTKTTTTAYNNNCTAMNKGGKHVNQCIGERANVSDIASSLTCTAVESGCVTSGARPVDRLASKINNNYNLKYYGFLDSGDDENGSEKSVCDREANGGGANAASNARPMLRENDGRKMSGARTFKPFQAGEAGCCEASPASCEKETVYENLRVSVESDQRMFRGDQADRRGASRGRTEVKKQNFDNLNRRLFEYNLRLGKYEKKLSDFSIPESSFRDIYNAGVINGSAFEDYSGLQDGFSYLESKYAYSVAGIPGNLAQASAAAAFFARASQKLNLSSPHRRKRHSTADDDPENSTGFSGAIHRNPPPMPPALLRRIGVKEVTGVGKVKVMLRVTGGSHGADSATTPSFFNIDSRKKQVTLYDPALCGAPAAPEDRRVGIAAPKMFAFDAIFSEDDSQTEICATALTEVIHAVINGTDGCLFCFGHAKLGKTATMLGTAESSGTLGIIPCAISWLFRGIHEQKQKTGARFSVRVSAVEVCQPTQQLKDLLAGHANDCEQSPGVYLRDDPLFGTQLQNQSELRVPNAEKAAFYLDAAVNSRSGKEEGRDSHFLYTLHVYQYSVAGKGGVAGGRSRLHLIDLGSCDRGKAGGGIPLSGLGNVLLGIFNGQKHLPYREHKITQLLKECLSSLTCHAAMIAHVSQSSQHYTDTLTTVQLASRIHRMRRKKIKFGGPSAPATVSTGSSSDDIARQNASTGSSDFDPSSSEQSADTVIYVGPTDDTATDGEHPPVYIPSLNSGDNRCAMGRALRGSMAENHPSARTKHSSPAKSVGSHKASDEKLPGGSLHKCNRSGISSSKSSPVRTASNRNPAKSSLDAHGKTVLSNAVQASRNEEQWIDGPRISKQKVAEARNILLKEHIKKETWIDGPMQKTAKPSVNCQGSGGYGFMDSHKKTMIRKWVENQTVHLKQALGGTANAGFHRSSEPTRDAFKEMTVFKTCNDYEEVSQRHVEGSSHTSKQEKTANEDVKSNVTVNTALIKQTTSCIKELSKQETEGAVCGESSESSEEEKLPPPPLPLILRYGKEMTIGPQSDPIKRVSINDGMIDDYDDEDEEIELEIVEVTEFEEPVPMQDSCLQVTEEDIALCMGEGENPLPEVDQESHEEHPLRILSQENLTVVSTFTDSMSVATDLERCLPRPRYEPPSLFDQPFHPNGTFYHDEYIELITQMQNPANETLDQLARLHQIYKSKLSISNQNNGGKSGARCQSLSLSDVFENNISDCNEFVTGNCSIYSEPAYIPPKESESMCNSCKKDLSSKAENAEKVLRIQKFCDKLNVGTKRHISSLRHPDGASNPSLDEEEKKERVPGNGASKSDFEEDNKDKSTPKKKVSKDDHRKGSANNSPNRKLNHHSGKSAHETTKQAEKPNESFKNSDIVKLNESNLIINNSPTRNSNSPSRGELRRTNSSSTNKSRRIEESEDVTKCSTPPPPSSSSPLTQKHLYFNKTCPSNEGSDSGHESNVSPKIAKINMRSRPQGQCESSGYESVVSFTSSLDSEVGVKLIREDPDEVHDPGGQSAWWCWCVSGHPTAVQGSRRRPQRHPSGTGRSPLTVPPVASHPSD